ncbi:ADP-ribosylglycohydrolase family protein [Streptomyces sp. NPDC002734]|uniref:ADP-ribosylglycohydrolase family protein n=1 Tax=Streptomyces sp. NPDC002734 TaxID=3154426 RepID=UPI00332882F3
MTTPTTDPSSHPRARLDRALASLTGLTVGDALGSQFFVPANGPLLRGGDLPPGTWGWTDDTEMACSVVAVLAARGGVDQDELAAAFARHHDFDRGYGPAVNRMLRLVREGGDWRELSAALFEGQGSWGNGAAMRIAPLGAWFADDPERAVREATLSAVTTHRHPEGVAGAQAVAAAAALAARSAGAYRPEELIDGVLALLPARSMVGLGLERVRTLLDYEDSATVAAVVGCGRRSTAQDTVPFALWSAARAGNDFRKAFWTTARAGGDVDTTCAVVGGVVAAAGPAGAPPAEWTGRTEPLPAWVPETVGSGAAGSPGV